MPDSPASFLDIPPRRLRVSPLGPRADRRYNLREAPADAAPPHQEPHVKLPTLEDPAPYEGLYVFDFGEWAAVGYTADEIAVLIEEPRYDEGKVYRIHRAHPDGSMELYAVARERFAMECGMFFLRATFEAARNDFDELCRLAEETPPPCRAYVRLVRRGGDGEPGACVVALVYPAEYDPDVARWLIRLGYQGGDTVEGGVSAVTTHLNEQHEILDRRQLWSANSESSRTREQVLASVRRAVQR